MDKETAAVWNRTRQRFWKALAADCELQLEEQLANRRLELATLVERCREAGAWEAIKVAQDVMAECYAISARAHTFAGEVGPLPAPPVANDREQAQALPGPKDQCQPSRRRKLAKGGRR